MEPNDARLRDRGFRIHSRPSHGPTTWERGSEVFVEQEALRIAEREHREAMATLEAAVKAAPKSKRQSN